MPIIPPWLAAQFALAGYSAWVSYCAAVLQEMQRVYEVPPMRRLSPQTGGNVIWLAEWKRAHGQRTR